MAGAALGDLRWVTCAGRFAMAVHGCCGPNHKQPAWAAGCSFVKAGMQAADLFHPAHNLIQWFARFGLDGGFGRAVAERCHDGDAPFRRIKYAGLGQNAIDLRVVKDSLNNRPFQGRLS